MKPDSVTRLWTCSKLIILRGAAKRAAPNAVMYTPVRKAILAVSGALLYKVSSELEHKGLWAASRGRGVSLAELTGAPKA